MHVYKSALYNYSNKHLPLKYNILVMPYLPLPLGFLYVNSLCLGAAFGLPLDLIFSGKCRNSLPSCWSACEAVK
jgi:hypothetical protein